MKWIVAIAVAFMLNAGWAGERAASASMPPVTGKVLEVKDVEQYTYLRLKTKDGDTWAAVPKATVKTGSDVTIENPMVMTNFQSRSLNRKFDKIVFGTLAGAGPAGAPTGNLSMVHGATGNTPDVSDVKVAKATGPNAHTVAELITKKDQLKNKPVTVRGKVVKYTPDVMGKNWVHLRDGSGSAANNTNDILVATKDRTKIGDVVLAKGIVHTDRDLGAGYSYKVLIEEATLQK